MGVVGVTVGVVISATFIGVFVGEAVTVMDGRVGRRREEDGKVVCEGKKWEELLSGKVLSGLVMVAELAQWKQSYSWAQMWKRRSRRRTRRWWWDQRGNCRVIFQLLQSCTSSLLLE